MCNLSKACLMIALVAAMSVVLLSGVFASGYVATAYYSSTYNGVVEVYNTGTGALVQSIALDPSVIMYSMPTAAVFAKNGDLLVNCRNGTGGGYYVVRFAYLGSGTWNTGGAPVCFVSNYALCTGIGLSAAGDIYSGTGSTDEIFSYTAGSTSGVATLLATVTGTNAAVWDMRVDPSGTKLWISKQNSGIKAIDIATGTVGVTAGPSVDYRGFVFGADGYLYAGTGTRVDMFDPTTGNLIGNFVSDATHISYVQSLAFGPDYDNDGKADLYVGDIGKPAVNIYSSVDGRYLGTITVNTPYMESVSAWNPYNLTANVDLTGFGGDLNLVNTKVDVLDSTGASVATQTVNASTGTSDGHGGTIVPVNLQVDPGTYTVRATAPKWLSKSASTTVTAGAVVTVDLSMPNGDINGDNVVEDSDYAIMSGTWYQRGD